MLFEDRQLSDRERTVLLLAAEGLTDKEIARNLDLSQRTIATYWERVRQKLGPYSRTQLVARFLRVEPEEQEDPNYRGLFAGWEEGVWILGPDGRTIYANHRISQVFGMDSEAFFAADSAKLFHHLTSIDLQEFLSSAQHGPQKAEFSAKGEHGTQLWLSLRASAMLDDEGACRAVVILMSDLTIQKRVKHTLDSCESTLSFLAERSGDLIARFDGDLTCVTFNPTYERVCEVPRQRVEGKRIAELSELFQPVAEWEKRLSTALQTGAQQQFESKTPFGMRTTYLLPEPSPDFLPLTVLALTVITDRISEY